MERSRALRRNTEKNDLLPWSVIGVPSEIFIRIRIWERERTAVEAERSGDQSEGKRDLVGRIKVPCPMQIRSARVGFDGTWRDCGHRLPTARLISSRYVVVAVTQARNSRELLEIHRTSRPATRDPLYTTVSVQSRWTFVSTKLKTRFRLRFREIQARLNHSGAGRKFLTRRWRNRQSSTSSG